MSLYKIYERVKRINYLIEKKSTGNSECLANKLHLSKSGLEKFIVEMQEMGIPIAYNRKNKNYCYTKDEEFYYKLFSGKISKEDIENFGGGVKTFFNFFQNLLIVGFRLVALHFIFS